MTRERPPAEATLRDYKERMLRVLVHIQRHLDESLELDALARVACFSPFHFHRIFKGMTGESLHAHIRRLRLERAAGELKVNSASVTELALRAGFETHEAFTRAFKAAFGVAPSHFRARKRPAPARLSMQAPFSDEEPARAFRMRSRKPRNMNVTIKTIEPMRVAFVRNVGPYSDAKRAWEKLLPLLGKEGFIGGDSLFIGVCHDDPDVTPLNRLRYDACVKVDAQFRARGEIGVQTIAGGEYAMTTHFGPYDRLGETYGKLFGQWLPRSGREVRSAPCFEVYLNDPESTAPSELLTDIYLPLEGRRSTNLKGVPS